MRLVCAQVLAHRVLAHVESSPRSAGHLPVSRFAAKASRSIKSGSSIRPPELATVIYSGDSGAAMKRILITLALGLVTVAGYAQWSNPGDDIPAYHPAAPTKDAALP